VGGCGESAFDSCRTAPVPMDSCDSTAEGTTFAKIELIAANTRQ
jgi:hypothetical protein